MFLPENSKQPNNCLVAIIWKINELYNDGFMIGISKGYFNSVIPFKINDIPFDIYKDKLIFIDNNKATDTNCIIRYLEFDIDSHSSFIDFNLIENTSDVYLQNNITFKDILYKEGIINKFIKRNIESPNFDIDNNFDSLDSNPINIYIGIVSYYSPNINQGYIVDISINSYGEKINFNIHEIPFETDLNQILVIDNSRLNERNGIKHYSKFIPAIHSCLIDTDIIRKSGGIYLCHESNINIYLIENNIAKGDGLISEIKALTDKISFGYKDRSSLLKYNNIEDFVLGYSISYKEGGHNKPGDWSNAWIKIETSKSYNNDIYLEKLLPDYSVTLAKGYDGEIHPFKSDILMKLQTELGYDEISRIKNLCKESTLNFRQLTILMYNCEDHLNALVKHKNELYSKLIDKYK